MVHKKKDGELLIEDTNFKREFYFISCAVAIFCRSHYEQIVLY